MIEVCGELGLRLQIIATVIHVPLFGLRARSECCTLYWLLVFHPFGDIC